jgi:F0F1-type ATP synthase assembly protein I
MSANNFANLRLAAWREALRVLAVQTIAMLALGGVATVVWDVQAGLGALIGAGIGLLANAYFAFALVGKPLLTGRSGDVLLSWAIKVMLTLGLLWIAMRTKIAAPPALVAGYAGSLVAHWMAGMFWLRGHR